MSQLTRDELIEQVSALALPGLLFEIEAIAARPRQADR